MKIRLFFYNFCNVLTKSYSYFYGIKMQTDINQNDIKFMWGTNNFLWTRSNPALPFWSGPVLSGPKNIKQNSEETLHCSFCRTVEVMESKKKRKEEERSGAADRAVAEWHWAADGGCSSFLHHFSLFRLPLVFCFCACCSSSFCFLFSFAFLSISSCFSFGSSFLF